MASIDLTKLSADELQDLARKLAPILAPLLRAEFVRMGRRNGGFTGI